MVARDGQSWERCEWTVDGLDDVGVGCLQGESGVQEWDVSYGAARAAAVGGWSVRVEWGFHSVWGSARRQVVHGGAHSPGSPGGRSYHRLPRSHPLHMYLPNGMEDDDQGERCHGGSAGGQDGEYLGLGEALEKSGKVQEVCFAVPLVVWAWSYGPPGSKLRGAGVLQGSEATDDGHVGAYLSPRLREQDSR